MRGLQAVSFLEGYADAAGVDGGEFCGAPGFFLEGAVGVDPAAALLVLGVKGGDVFNQKADHGLFADGLGEGWVAESDEVDAGALAFHAGVRRRGGVAEGFGEAADIGPPGEGGGDVGGGEDGDGGF